ncbi:MAG: leucyl/phenylalanyl-tRNA--protein transferase [Verrucomicrobiota bacterium]|nr:leucyl/phenylalanyl-tRNA--protein transferase [Verrucomicrobiota bacterium]
MIPPDQLLEGYVRGIFPMAMEDGEIAWFSPDPRAIIPLEGFHVPHGVGRAMAKSRFEVRIDCAFEEVMRGCADRADTWIGVHIIESYVELHRLGYAHSVESWLDGELAGGLYGVTIGGAFFGESMFHVQRDASNIALCALVSRCRSHGYQLLDTQWLTPHLVRFGAIEIPRAVYLDQLKSAVQLDCHFA